MQECSEDFGDDPVTKLGVLFERNRTQHAARLRLASQVADHQGYRLRGCGREAWQLAGDGSCIREGSQ